MTAASCSPRGSDCDARRTLRLRSVGFTTDTLTESGFPHGLGQRCQVVLVRRTRRESTLVPHEFPPLGGGDSRTVRFAQVPRVGFGNGGQWTDDSGGIRVHVGQRRNSWVLAPRPAASTQCSHGRERSAPEPPGLFGHTVSSPRIFRVVLSTTWPVHVVPARSRPDP
jgi:hypothetical protein